jgi:GTP 3',8-cyclase
MFDSYGRQIDYLRISLTEQCNLRCTYCMPEDGASSRPAQKTLSFDEILSVVDAAAGLGITKVRLTGGEPLIRPGIVELVQLIAAVPGILTVAMTTNGVLLARYAAALKAAGLDVVNVSMDTLDAVRFLCLTRVGRLQDVIDGVLSARAAGIERIKVNTVVGPDTPPEDVAAVRSFCDAHGLIHQRIAQFSLDSDKDDDHDCDRPLRCEDCNRIRLLSTGSLKPCLHSNEEVVLDVSNPRDSIRRTVAMKPERGTVCTNRSMAEIGG